MRYRKMKSLFITSATARADVRGKTNRLAARNDAMKRHVLVIFGVWLALTFSFGDAHAQSYPNRPIKLIAPFPPGGPLDVMARLVAQGLSATFGQVIVENRQGAGETLGAKE